MKNLHSHTSSSSGQIIYIHCITIYIYTHTYIYIIHMLKTQLFEDQITSSLGWEYLRRVSCARPNVHWRGDDPIEALVGHRHSPLFGNRNRSQIMRFSHSLDVYGIFTCVPSRLDWEGDFKVCFF